VTVGLLGNTLATFGRDADAIEVLEPAVGTARDLYGGKRPNTELARLEGFLASSMISVGRFGEAEELLRIALADQWALDGCDTIRNNYTRQMLAIVRAKRGDLEEGIALMRQALAADAKLNATATVDTGTITAILGEMMVEAGQFEEGLAAIDRAEVIVVEAGGAGQEYPSIRRQLRRANALLLAGQAEAALAEATLLLDRVGDAEGWIPAAALRLRVAALRELSRLGEADELLPALLQATQAPKGSASDRARAFMEAALLGLAQGRDADAAAFAQDAVALLLPTQVPQSRLLRRARDIAARCGRR
jgi:hypothetical protein